MNRALRQEVRRLIIDMTDEQCQVALEAFKISVEDNTKTPEECCALAYKRLNRREALS
jgi:hypothetical protein|nr:MAG TPA: hypothetical protein [Caudoviricetes sp.]